ncbi:TorF family putative porin [Colwellia psychrerythraea]|uniref:TIGR02001 family outer membrane protein n=1 Tax=Colwellia psychrerythraea TaxID=28229 RepID=A0A099KZ47_COLPS|nr:TorF family putative porin [Colwellia psychrerythraea]KGJ95087.1 Conserved hypothetical protein CHP02001 [Colwellia psychrerythraea]
MNNMIFVPALFTTTLLTSTFFSAEIIAEDSFSANVGITSNYIWRGVSQSDDKFSVSAGADYSHESGFYLGTWAATVDFNDDTNFEYDFYSGYQTNIADINWDIGYIYYGYQGEDNLAFSEIYLRANYQALTLAASTLVDNDTDGEFGDSQYYEASYGFTLPYHVSLDLHAGYYSLPSDANYSDYNISLSKSNFTLMVSTLTGNDALKDTLVSLSYSNNFDF